VHSHLKSPRSSIYIMDLPALRTIPFLRGNGLIRLHASPCWHQNGLAPQTARWLIAMVADVAGLWPAWIAAGLRPAYTGVAQKPGQRDKQGENTMPVLQRYARHSLRRNETCSVAKKTCKTVLGLNNDVECLTIHVSTVHKQNDNTKYLYAYCFCCS